jgi:phage terminase large subunit
MGKMLNATGRFTLSASRKNIGQQIREGSYKYTMGLYLMQFKNIHIHKTNCPNSQREFKSWSWKTDKAGKILDIVQDGSDHTVDSTIYALERDATIWFKNNFKR